MKIEFDDSVREYSCQVERPSGKSYLFFQQFQLQGIGMSIKQAGAMVNFSFYKQFLAPHFYSNYLLQSQAEEYLKPHEYRLDRDTNSGWISSEKNLNLLSKYLTEKAIISTAQILAFTGAPPALPLEVTVQGEGGGACSGEYGTYSHNLVHPPRSDTLLSHCISVHTSCRYKILVKKNHPEVRGSIPGKGNVFF